MILADFHVHTTFSDGKNTAAEVAAAAAGRGLKALGFSEHGYADCDRECCIPLEKEPEYVNTVAALREQYRGKLDIHCGMEQDFYSLPPADGVEYVIGSVHYLCRGDEFLSVDYLPENMEYMAENWYGGDFIALAEDYFAHVAAVYDQTRCDIIGHFDLVTKLNERHHYFSPSDPRYIAAWKRAADELLKTGKPFEINTGAIARGYRTAPYPAADIQRYISDNGGSFILSSDSHSAAALCFEFERWEQAARAAGIRLVPFEVPENHK